MRGTAMSKPRREFKPGEKVIVGGEVRLVKEYIEDTCGDGCCDGYLLEGDDAVTYWPGDLQPYSVSDEQDGRVLKIAERIMDEQKGVFLRLALSERDERIKELELRIATQAESIEALVREIEELRVEIRRKSTKV
jgi:hypothetical protein